MNRLGVAVIGLALATIVGCAGRVPLQYDHPAVRLNPDGSVIGCRNTDDRRADRALDEVLEGGSTRAVDGAIQEEVASTGIARSVLVLPGVAPSSSEDLAKRGVSVVIEPALVEMAWEVPDYEQLQTTTFILSVLTGGIGGLIYASTRRMSTEGRS